MSHVYAGAIFPVFIPTERSPNADLMLGQLLRRWPNIKSALVLIPTITMVDTPVSDTSNRGV